MNKIAYGNMILKKIVFIIAIIWGFIQTTEAVGTMTSVYLNPVAGNDSNNGSPTFPVRSWDKALQLAADKATIYFAWHPISITGDMTIDGSQYGATQITVAPANDFSGSFFMIGGSATVSNVTLKGPGTDQALISLTSGGTLSIGSHVNITDGGQISMDGDASPIELTATPPVGTVYPILTTYQDVTDEGRGIVDAGSVINPLQYFTLVAPVSTPSATYELDMDGTFIRLYERPMVGIYLDPLNGSDAYSGARSNCAVKTLSKAMSIWDARHLVVPDIPIYVLTRVTLTENLTLDDGIKFIRFAGDANRSITMMDTMFIYNNMEVVINEATIDNGSIGGTAGTALHSGVNGKLTLNNGATITSANTSNIIVNRTNGSLTMNEGASVTKTSTGSGYCIYNYSNSPMTMNGGTITNKGSSYCIYNGSNSDLTIYNGTIDASGSGIYKSGGTLTIHDVTINGVTNCIYNTSGVATIYDCTITSTGSNAVYNAGTMTIHDAAITTSGSNTVYNYSGTMTIHYCTITTTGTSTVYNYSGTMTINDCDIKNERTSTSTAYTVYHNSGTMIINGGTIDAGVTTGVYNGSSSSNGMTLNKADITSSNTTNGTIYSSYTLRLNGENVNIHGGLIYFNTTALDSYNIIITSPTVTQDYVLRIANNVPYTTLVKSTPSIDLGLYEDKFTLEPKPGYQLAAYANKGVGNRNLVLYNPNGVYVNDYTGSDGNTGFSPASPVKTLAVAAGKTDATKTQIYICDSTLTINSVQDVSQASVKDTITSFMFRTSTYLMRIASGGSLTLGNIAVYTTSTYVSRYIQMDAGSSLTLNEGSELMTYGKYGVYQTGGDVVMNRGSLIKYHPTSTSSSGYGIYQNGATSTATLNKGAIIEQQSYAIYLYNASRVDIKDSVILRNGSYAVYLRSGGTVNMDSAVIHNNSYAIYMTGGVVNVDKAMIRNNSSTINVSSGGILNLTGTTIQNNTGYQTLYMTGLNTVVTMTDGQLIDNGYQGASTSTSYQGAVYIYDRATFNFNGGAILRNNRTTSATTNAGIFGEQVRILYGGKMNFIKGEIAASRKDRNAIGVEASDTTIARASHLYLGSEAVLDSGFIFCNSTKYAPISLPEPLDPDRKYGVNLGDNMAGFVVVDGTSDGTVPADVDNFTLNPELTTLSLAQRGNDVVVGSTAIYLDGANGLDTNDGSSAAMAVRTFKRARERLQETSGDVVIVVGAANLGNADEISAWDLSFNPNAVLQRGLGYTGYLVNIPSGKSLTLSYITIDGNKDNFDVTTDAAIYSSSGGTLTINEGAVIKDNRSSYGIQISSGTIYMNGGSVEGHTSYGIYSYYGNFYMTGGTITGNTTAGVYLNSSSSRSDVFQMTGGSITENTSYGIYNNYTDIRLSGGEISKNGSYGIHNYYLTNAVMEINGTASISENRSYGVYNYQCSNAVMKIGGTATISENRSYGICNNSFSNTVLEISEMATISKNGSYGVYSSSSSRGVLKISGTSTISENVNGGIYFSSSALDSFIVSGGEIRNNTGIGCFVYANYVSITGGSIRDNGNYGLNVSASTASGSTFSMTGGEFLNNKGYGITTNIYSDLSITGGVVANNTGLGISASASSSAANTNASVSDITIRDNGSYGLHFSYYSNMSVENVEILRNKSYGLYIAGSTVTNPGRLTMSSGTIDSNTGYGVYLNSSYLTYDISGDVRITNNQNSGIYSHIGSLSLPSTISGNVLIKGNRAGSGGGLYVNQGTVNVFDNVVFEADTCTSYGGAIYVAANGNVVIGDAIIGDTVVTGNVQIRDCRNTTTSTSTSYGGSAIYALGRLSMTGGDITGCEALNTRGTVYVSGNTSNVNLTRVEISGNTARYGGAVYVNTDGKITLNSDTITGNTSLYLTDSIHYIAPVTGAVHIAGGIKGRLSLRDKCDIEGDLYLGSINDTVHIDEALLNASIGDFRLLGYTTNGTNQVMELGTVVVSPNGTTVTDASQFMTRFTLMNANTGRGLDKGGTDGKHIMIVNQFFIDGTKPDGGSGSSPFQAFNKISDLINNNTLGSSYTTVWVSGPVFVTGNDVLPLITKNDVSLRRYTGFKVASQEFEPYDSVMFHIQPGATLTIQGGNSEANRFTLSGEGGSSLSDASIFKNEGTLNIGGHTYLYFNPTGGDGAAIYQNGTLNLSGNVDFELYSMNTVYLPANKVINITDPFAPVNPIGVTVETSPANTQIPGRIVATGTTANVTPGMEDNFYNELALPHLPIGRSVSGTTANLMFYLADRNVTGVPIYTTLHFRIVR